MYSIVPDADKPPCGARRPQERGGMILVARTFPKNLVNVTERSLFSSLANRPGGFQGKAGDLILAREPAALVPGGVPEEFVEQLTHENAFSVVSSPDDAAGSATISGRPVFGSRGHERLRVVLE